MTTVTVTHRTHRFRRSINGAWLGNGADVTTREVDESQAGSYLAGAGICTDVTIKWPDGVAVSVGGGDSPARGYGWGPLGYVVDPRHILGRRQVHLHERLPGWALEYHGVRQITPEMAATFEPHRH